MTDTWGEGYEVTSTYELLHGSEQYVNVLTGEVVPVCRFGGCDLPFGHDGDHEISVDLKGYRKRCW